MSSMTGPLLVDGVPVSGHLPWYGGKTWYLDPYAGSDGYSGTKPTAPFKTLKNAYDNCVDKRGDLIVVMNTSQASTGFAVIPTATVSGVTTGFNWAKSNTHMYGLGPMWRREPRTSVRLGTGDVTTTTMFRLTGDGCEFTNVGFLQESAGNIDQIAVQVSGQRNTFKYCTISGGAHATPAARAGMRSLKIVGTGTGMDYGSSNVFYRCRIGLDTVLRGDVACAEIELAGTAARNEFIECLMETSATAGGTNSNLFVIVPAAGLWGTVLFDRCKFTNNYKLTGAGLMAKALNIATDANGHVSFTQCKTEGVVAGALQTANYGNVVVDGVGGAATGGRGIVATG